MEMENRWIDLETKSAYQERLIQELNEVVIAQQKQIDDLQKAVRRLEHLVRQNQAQAEQDVPPPHY